jgi:WD40 repeat protein
MLRDRPCTTFGRWQVCTLAGHSGPVGSAAFSPDGKLILSGSDDTLVKIWDVATRLEVRSVPQKALRGGIPGAVLEPLGRSWSHFVGIYRQKLTKSSKNDF